MKILFILDVYKPHTWGVEILFENIISRLEKRWHKIVILTSKFSNGVKKYERISENIEIYRAGSNRYNFMFSCLVKWIKLAKWCDLIHTTTFNSAIPSYIIWKFSRKKVIITVHEIFWKLWYKFMWWKWFFFKLFEDIIFKFDFEKYLCVSNYTKNSIRLAYGINDTKLITVYNWMDYKKWNKGNCKQENIEKIKQQYDLEDFYTWLYYWRPWISKGLEYYIKAIPNIVKTIPNFRAFLIVPENDNNRITNIKQIIKDLNLDKNIIWIPGIDNNELANYILSCDLAVVPSLTEWFWFCAVEICSLGQRIVVSEIASLPEVVSWKVNFVEPGNSKEIERAIINFHNDKYINIEDKKFYWENNIEKTLKIYTEVLWK